MSKESGSFLRKVARFVANPTTDWSDLDAPPSDAGESDYAKTEIKAMIERKRRNDFVRKRELDMLRKIRREGLSPDAALALGSGSPTSTPNPAPKAALARTSRSRPRSTRSSCRWWASAPARRQ